MGRWGRGGGEVVAFKNRRRNEVSVASGLHNGCPLVTKQKTVTPLPLRLACQRAIKGRRASVRISPATRFAGRSKGIVNVFVSLHNTSGRFLV